MSNALREINKRIGSIKNTKKVTKSMEMISAAKMQKIVKKVEYTRAYTDEIDSTLQQCFSEGVDHPFNNTRRDNEDELWIVISSNRGLCGGFNYKVLKELLLQLDSTNLEMKPDIIAIGRKSAQFAKKLDLSIVAVFDELGDIPSFTQLSPLLNIVVEGFTTGQYAKVRLIYTFFETPTKQEVRSVQVLPIQRIDEEDSNIIYEEKNFEPSRTEILDYLFPLKLKSELYTSILESAASEHSSRMIAMKNSTDSANEMTDSLQLIFNKSRQASITQEVAEIVGGMEVLLN